MKNYYAHSNQQSSFKRNPLLIIVFVFSSFFAVLVIDGCNKETDSNVEPEVQFQFDQLALKFQDKGIDLVLTGTSKVDNIGTSNAEKISYLIANSYIIGMDSTGTYKSIRLANLQDSVKANLNSLIASIVGSTPTTVTEVIWDYKGEILSSIALTNSATKNIVYAAISSNLSVNSREITSPNDRFVGFKEISQPTNPGDLYNRWAENIYTIDLYTVAISWGTAYCDEEGCIVIPNDPNLWIQVEIESSLGWTADAVVTSYQVSPDCKSVTFQITIVAAGPFATLDITTNADGIKVGASVKGPVGTFKKTLNKTWRCP